MPPPDEIAQREEFRRLWPAFFGVGVALVLAGFVALFVPSVIADFAVMLWGWFLIARGGVDLIGSFFARRQSAFLSHLLSGILALVVGFLIVSLIAQDKEVKVERVILLLITAFLLVSGLVQIVVGLALRSEAWSYTLFSGVVSVVIGVLVWRNVGDPEKVPYMLGIFIGIDLLSRGATWIGLGLAAKNAPKGSPPMAT
jgi:uncharacterized membrane protein HdeD (DUF308 family)